MSIVYVVYTLQVGSEANEISTTPVSLITFNMLVFFAILFIIILVALPILFRKLKEDKNNTD